MSEYSAEDWKSLALENERIIHEWIAKFDVLQAEYVKLKAERSSPKRDFLTAPIDDAGYVDFGVHAATVDWAGLNAMFAHIPAGPYSADKRGDGWEVRAIDTDPTNKHHWPYRLCESIRGQKAGCDADVFGFIAGVMNAWPSITEQLAVATARIAEMEAAAAAADEEIVHFRYSREIWKAEAKRARDQLPAATGFASKAQKDPS